MTTTTDTIIITNFSFICGHEAALILNNVAVRDITAVAAKAEWEECPECRAKARRRKAS